MASCFDAFKECRDGGVRALLFAVQISSHVSLFPSFISPVIIDTSCYWFTTGEFPSFEGYVFASNNLLNHTINEIGLFLAFFFFFFGFPFCMFFLWLFYAFCESLPFGRKLSGKYRDFSFPAVFIKPYNPCHFSKVLS